MAWALSTWRAIGRQDKQAEESFLLTQRAGRSHFILCHRFIFVQFGTKVAWSKTINMDSIDSVIFLSLTLHCSLTEQLYLDEKGVMPFFVLKSSHLLAIKQADTSETDCRSYSERLF